MCLSILKIGRIAVQNSSSSCIAVQQLLVFDLEKRAFNMFNELVKDDSIFCTQVYTSPSLILMESEKVFCN